MEHSDKSNYLLRYERERRGWSQRKVAELIDTSEDMVSRWERGKRKTSPYYQEKLCILFGKDAMELGFIGNKEEISSKRQETVILPHGEDKDINGRQMLHMPEVTGITLFNNTQTWSEYPLWERLSRTLSKSSSIDESTVSELETIARNYWQLRAKIGYRDLLNSFLGHLELIVQLLRYSQPPKLHKRLCSLASEVAQRIGSIHFDLNDLVTARAYYTVAIQSAQEAENYTLWAVGLGRMSSLPTYSGYPQQAIPLLQEAQNLATQHSTEVVQAWLASVKAEAFAKVQDIHACFRSLRDAERCIERAEQIGNTDGISFDYARLAGYEGVCYLHFRRPRFALHTLDEAVRLIDSSSIRQRSIMLADSAIAYAQQSDMEQACERASQALNMAFQIKSSLVMQRIRQFRGALKPAWETTRCVKDLDEQIALAHL